MVSPERDRVQILGRRGQKAVQVGEPRLSINLANGYWLVLATHGLVARPGSGSAESDGSDEEVGL